MLFTHCSVPAVISAIAWRRFPWLCGGGSHDLSPARPPSLSRVIIYPLHYTMYLYVANNRISVNPPTVQRFIVERNRRVFFFYFTIIFTFLDHGARLYYVLRTRLAHDAITRDGGCPRTSSLPYNNNLCYYSAAYVCVYICVKMTTAPVGPSKTFRGWSSALRVCVNRNSNEDPTAV